MHRRTKDPRSAKRKERDQALINYAEDAFIKPWKVQRRPWVLQYLLNRAYYNGHQFVEMRGGSLVKRRRRPREVQIAHNHFAPAARVVLGQVTKNRPIMDLRAMRSGFTPEAEMIAGRRILKGLQYETRHQNITEQNWMNMMFGGSSYKRVTYNENCGQYGEHTKRDDDNNEVHLELGTKKERPDPEVTEIIAKELRKRFDDPESIPVGAEQIVYEELFTPVIELRYEGGVDVDVWNIMEVGTDQGYWSLQEADMVFMQRWRSNRFIEKTWPELGRAVEPEFDVPLLYDSAGHSNFLPGVSLARTVGPEDHVTNRQDGAVVTELWVKPTKLNPLSVKVTPGGTIDHEADLKPAELGCRLVWANGVILEGHEDDLSDAPMPNARTPGTDQIDANFDISDYRWMTEPAFNGTPMLTNAIPLQNAINMRRGMMIAAINSHTFAKLLMPRNALVREDAISNTSGEIVDYQGTPPHYLEPPTMPSHLFRMLDDDTKQFNDTLMLHEVSREGRVPPAVRTASALIRLQETDNLALAPVMLRYEESERDTAQMILDRSIQYYEEGRLVTLIGDTNQLEVEVFKKGQLFRGRANVYVHEGSSLPDSLAANMQMLFDFLQFAPWMMTTKEGAPDRAKVARLLNVPAFNDWLQEEDESRQAAEWENAEMDQGRQIMPLATDEDAVHLAAHYPVLRSPDFRKKPEAVQQIMQQHAAMHEQRLFQKIQNMQGISAQMGGQAQEAAARQDQAAAAGNGQQPAGNGASGGGGSGAGSISESLVGAARDLMEGSGL